MTETKTKKQTEELSSAGNREKSVYCVLTVLLVAAGAYLMFDFGYNLANMLGAIVSGTAPQALVQLKHILPTITTAFAVIFQGVCAIYTFKASDKKKRAALHRRSGIVSLLLGIFNVIYIINGITVGEYHGAVEGNPYLLFPLDLIIGGALMAFFGLFQLGYAQSLKISPSKLPCIKDTRGTAVKIADAVFYPIAYCVALYSVAALVYSTFVMDFAHGYLFYNIMLLSNFALPVIMLVYYRFVFLNKTEKYRKTAQLKASLAFLISAIVLLGIYLLSVQLQNEAPAQNAFGLLPIEFTASFNAFPFIYGLNNIAIPLAALIKCAKYKK